MTADRDATVMTVGELSRRTGVPIKALRQYTDWGLIYTVGRTAGNYRLFTADALWCVRRIGELRGLGLTLAEIRELTTAYLQPRPDRDLGDLLARRLGAAHARQRARIAEAQHTLDRIDAYLRDQPGDLADPTGPCWSEDQRAC